MAIKASLVWFRLDLRLEDNPALTLALERGGPVVPVFIWSPEEEVPWQPGAASRWWLHQSLESLNQELQRRGSRLIIRAGPSLETLAKLVEEVEADAVFWNRRYEPKLIARDASIKTALRGRGLHVASGNAALLFEPWEILNRSERPFQVYSPFWKTCLNRPEPAAPRPAPTTIPAPASWPSSFQLAELKLEPTIDWTKGMRSAWRPGTVGAAKLLESFLAEAVGDYGEGRNIPGVVGTSRLSPHLHFGEISPRTIWHAVHARRDVQAGGTKFLSEIGWREFAHHLLFHFPDSAEQPLRPEFSRFPWLTDPVTLRAWQRGRTGYPLVDAGLRELWTTGWMHNRVRMVVGSFLVKDLLLPWRAGADWFWDTLVDADLANNTLGWQWIAGCGADAAPYFRVFNPVLQGEKFDPHGAYVRRWMPELARLPNEFIQRPWEAPKSTLTAAGIELGRTYPRPVVDHAEARSRALEALGQIKKV